MIELNGAVADEGDERDRARDERDDGHEVGDVPVCPPAPELALDRHVDRQERRDEHARGHQLVDLRGQVVGHLVAAREHGGAHGEGLGPRAGKARDAAHDHERAHHGRGTCDGGFLAAGVLCAFGLREGLGLLHGLLGLPLLGFCWGLLVCLCHNARASRFRQPAADVLMKPALPPRLSARWSRTALGAWARHGAAYAAASTLSSASDASGASAAGAALLCASSAVAVLAGASITERA